jgi:hypothetical protein
MLRRYKPLKRTAIKRKPIINKVVIHDCGREVLCGQAWEDRRKEVHGREHGYCQSHMRRGVVVYAPLHDAYDEQGDLMSNAGHVHHKRTRGMGGCYRDDRLPNLEWLCCVCHAHEGLPSKPCPPKPLTVEPCIS